MNDDRPDTRAGDGAANDDGGSPLRPGLYVVATPIGNLGDFSERARRVLAAVDLIAAEDTRHSRRLLQHFGIDTPSLSLHDHNERARLPSLLARLRAGETVALVSDAGTPLVSDPGFRLVRGARAQRSEVFAVPGPCSAIAALSIAGLPSDRFAFEGFPPPKDAARRRYLETLSDSPYTLIFFEAARRVAACVADMAGAFGAERPALVARELSKLYEQSRLDTLGALADWLRAETPRGEFVIVVHGSAGGVVHDDADPAAEPALSAAAERMLRRLLPELPLKRAVAITAELCDEPRNRVYGRALAIGRQS